jgi:hypothetical protein
MISREEVIRRIVECEMQGQSLTEENVLQDVPDLHQAACERFGTWDTALEYAGARGYGISEGGMMPWRLRG